MFLPRPPRRLTQPREDRLADIDLMPMLYDLRKPPKGSEMIESKKNLDVYYERLAEPLCSARAIIAPRIPRPPATRPAERPDPVAARPIYDRK